MSKGDQQILEINNAFYQAFSNSDIQAMESLWSSQHDVAVIHPGWSALHGRDSVLSSWRQIMESGNSPTINCLDAKVYLQDKIAIVICTEKLSEGSLIATNIFVMEDNSWKMIHHQAGPLPDLVVHSEKQSLH